MKRLSTLKPKFIVVTIRNGLVEEVRCNQPGHVLIEDWDTTEVRPAHNEMSTSPLLSGEEAELRRFFFNSIRKGD